MLRFSPCIDIGADILDSTNQNVFSFGILEEQDTWWELCPEQKTYFEYTQHLNAYLREEYHSLNVMSTETFIKKSFQITFLTFLEFDFQKYAAQRRS